MVEEQCSPAVQRLLACLPAVLAETPAELPGPVALADTRALMAVGDALRAAALGRLADVEARQLYALEDASSTGAWVDTQPCAAGRDEVSLARRFTRMPHVRDQVAAGQLSIRTASAVGVALDKAARHLDRPDGRIGGQPGEQVLTNVIVEGVLQLVAEGVGGFDDDDLAFDHLLGVLVEIVQAPVTQLARLERAFVVLAQQLPVGMLGAGLDRLLAALTPQQLEDADERGHRDRAFRMVLKPDGSGYRITRGDLTLELGEHLAAVVAAQRATDPDNPGDSSARAQLHEEPAGPEPRSRVQQDHDALLLGLRALLDSGVLGQRHKVAPHVAVTTSLGALHELPGALPAISRTTGTLLPRSLVRRLLCDSSLTRLVLGLRGRVLEISHTERTAKAHERLAVATRWGHRCAEAGCPSPPGTTLIPHHATPWHQTGTTSLADTVPVCQLTHDHLHVRGRTITLRDGRRLDEQGWLDDGRAAA